MWIAFLSFIGCDTRSAFCAMVKRLPGICGLYIQRLQRFFMKCCKWCKTEWPVFVTARTFCCSHLWTRASACVGVTEARKHLFTHKSRSWLKKTLHKHIKQAMYQAYIWSLALVPWPQLPSPSDWGWVNTDDGWQPLPEACFEHLHCGCK